MKKLFIFLLIVLIIGVNTVIPVSALEIKDINFDFNIKSAVLMDAETGAVLYSLNMNQMLPPASVTKIMTMLLIFEAIDNGMIKYDDLVTVSDYASSMGGSQVFLEPGEEISVNELLKCIAVASANDGAVAMAEYIAGSEEEFVRRMNEKAAILGMKNTHFENVTGLDDDVKNHLTSAYDIALMSKELLKHEDVTKYTTIWMDSIRGGSFGLSNTNKLVRYYRGITGLKTGSTDKAGFCVSASAKRDEMHLIAVIMGAETSKERNEIASKLLDFGFANYERVMIKSEECEDISVIGGEKIKAKIGYNDYLTLENKGNSSKIEKKAEIYDSLQAPIRKGDLAGKIYYYINGKEIGCTNVYVMEDVNKISFLGFYLKILTNILI